MTDPSLADRLSAAIEADGAISVAKYMAAANAHYYGSRDPLGARGDFITAPEISQIFGELIGLCLADLWIRAGRPRVHLAEFGPGRGTLARDVLRAMATVGLLPDVHFVETSLVLRAKQAERVPGAQWHSTVSALPTDAPLFVIANEFFDALPIHQIIKSEGEWRQRLIGLDSDRFVAVPGKPVPAAVVPAHLADAPEGSIIETCPDAIDIARTLAQRIGEQGGVMLAIDYGYQGPAVGDTLQAVSAHGFADPFTNPGEHDLTAHVDFTTLAAMGELCGVAVHGLVDQGVWLDRLGLRERTASLASAHPDQAAGLDAAAARLADPDQMGSLFKIIAFSAGDWPVPAGFA